MTRKQRTTALYARAEELGLTYMETSRLTRARKSLGEISAVLAQHPSLVAHVQDGRLWIVRRRDIREGERVEEVYARGMEVVL